MSRVSTTPALLLLLAAAAVGSALAVVDNIHTRRQLLGQMQQLGSEADRIHTEWRQLLLEQSALGAQVRVDRVARERLRMVAPNRDNTVLVDRR